MTLKVVVAFLAALLVAACTPPVMSEVSVELPIGTDNSNAAARAQGAVNRAASELCGEPVTVPVKAIVISTSTDGIPRSYKAVAEVRCG